MQTGTERITPCIVSHRTRCDLPGGQVEEYRDLISALAHKLGVPKEALQRLLAERRALVSVFAEEWKIPEDAVQQLLKALRDPQPIPSEDSKSTTYLDPEEFPLPDANSSNMTLDTGVFLNDDFAGDGEFSGSLPGSSLSPDDCATEEISIPPTGVLGRYEDLGLRNLWLLWRRVRCG